MNHPPVLSSQYLSLPEKPKDNLGIDAVREGGGRDRGGREGGRKEEGGGRGE